MTDESYFSMFGNFLKGPNTISVKNYILKENEEIDGDTIRCTKCGETKRYRKFSRLYGEEIWASAVKDSEGLCECEREAIKEQVRKENDENFKRIYNCPFLKNLIGKGYCDVHFSDIEKNIASASYQNALKSCQSYVTHIDNIIKRGLGMYLYSHNAGTGKTTMMSALRNALLESNVRCVFVNESDLVSFAKNPNDRLDDNGWFTYSVFETADVLILDDIGVGNLTADNNYTNWRNDILYHLIELRNRDNRCTCFTSNYSPEELRTKRGIDFKTVDRIIARSSRVICVEGASFRGGNIIEVGN